MDETKVPPRKIKVVDRRKFTSNGDPLEESPAPQATKTPGRSSSPAVDPPQPAPEQSKGMPRTTSSTEGIGREPSSLFVELVVMLAGQAELLMVGAEDLPAKPVEAKRLIDYLGILETKTAGNLSDEETKVLSNILYHLRSLYLQKT